MINAVGNDKAVEIIQEKGMEEQQSAILNRVARESLTEKATFEKTV